MTNEDPGPDGLAGVRILVVEDEYYLAEDLAAALRAGGAEVVGPVGTLEEAAREVSRPGLDCAIVDMNLRGDMAFPVADQLERAGIPFLIATGYNSASLPERFSNTPRVEKPFDPASIMEVIPALIGRREA